MLVELGLTMPKVGLIDRKYRGMTADDIYSKLVKDNKKSPAHSLLISSEVGQGSGSADGENAATGWDLHISPDDLRGQSVRSQEFPTAEERKRLRVSITKSLADKIRGIAPGLFESEIQQAKGGQVPWRTLLSRFFTGIRRDDYRLFPPNKKHIWRGIYLPSMGAPGPNHIIVAVDTSGSMSDQVLGEILGELDKLRSVTDCTITVIQCDAKIHKVDEFDAFNETKFDRYIFQGRGGTAFEPVFDWIRDKSQRSMFQFDALIYITDGFGSFPPKPPPYPVMWIMTEHSRPDIPFGEVIRMGKQQQAAVA
jgi:predicted metal-dependent peptidase